MREADAVSLLDVAIDYAINGWYVFPVTKEKAPFAGTKGLLEATIDIEQIKKWWTEKPDALVAVNAGMSGLLCLDFDEISTYENLLRDHPTILATRIHKTGSGGRHAIYLDGGHRIKSTSKAMMPELPGVHTRADGGYFIVAGTSIKGTYDVLYGGQKPKEIPELLMMWLKGAGLVDGAAREHKPVSTTTVPVKPEVVTPGPRHWVEKYSSEARVGQRHSIGAYLAAQLKAEGLSESEAQPHMLEYQRNVDRHDDHYTEQEALDSLAYVYMNYAQKAPIDVTQPRLVGADGAEIKVTPEHVEQAEYEQMIERAKNAASHAGIPEKIVAAAIKILKDDDPLEFIIRQVGRMHKSDENAARILVLSQVDIAVLNSKGYHPGCHGMSGKGKTDLCKAVKQCSPEGDIIETSLSGKSLFYNKIDEGTVIFADDVELDDSLRSTLKRASSNFTEPTRHMTVIKGEGASKWIPARVVWWLTSVDTDDDDQVLNREIPLPVDESEETDNTVFEQQIILLKTGRMPMVFDDDIETARAILFIIKRERCFVTFPLADIIEWKNKNNRRNFDVFADLLKSVALMNRLKPGHARITPAHGIMEVAASVDDFEKAVDIYGQFGQAQATKLTEIEMSILKFLSTKFHGATINEIQASVGKGRSRVYQILHGKDGQGGMLKKVDGLMYEPETELIETSDRVRKSKPHNIYRIDQKKFETFKLYENVVSNKNKNDK
jgi:hypothetical protein